MDEHLLCQVVYKTPLSLAFVCYIKSSCVCGGGVAETSLALCVVTQESSTLFFETQSLTELYGLLLGRTVATKSQGSTISIFPGLG